MDLISPIVRVTIGDDLFMSGDGLLRHASVSLGEDARSSKCRFEVYDPGLKIAAKYFEMSFARGGIEVPDDLLEDPSKSSGDGKINIPDGGSSVADAAQKPEIKAWLDTIAWCEGTSGADGYNIIFTGAKFSGNSHPNQIKCSGGLCSNAAGRYQFLSTTWAPLGLPDFSPVNQDKGAVMLLQNRGALGLAEQGESAIAAVCDKISYEWASIPPYRYKGQGTKSLGDIQQYWKQRYAQYKGAAPSAAPATPPQTAAATPPPIKDEADSKPQEVSKKGTEIIVEMGFQPDQLVAYHFIHIGTHTEGRQLDSTVFEGQCVRWLMTRRTKNAAYKDITLRDLAAKVAKSHGLTLEMDGDGPKYQHLDQSGITDYQLLLRECRAVGYSLNDAGAKLIIKPWKPNFTGFVITPDILKQISFDDKASKDMSPAPTASPTTPETGKDAAPTVQIDRLSGKPVAQKPEDTTATGKADGKKVATTGPAVKPLSGTPSPESVAAVDGGSEAITGLPTQAIGAIDIGDGKAEATAIKDESRRVKGYESSATVKTTPAVLTLAPGSIIGVSRLIVPEVFAREWRVGSVDHAYQSGALNTSLKFYSPQKAKAGEGAKINIPDGVAPPKGKIANPHGSGGQRGTPFDPGGAIRGRPHKGIDTVGAPNLVAGIPGTITDVVTGCSVGDRGCGSGYGNYVEITGEGDWAGFVLFYGHMASVAVSKGQKIKAGQGIGVMGDTGFSFGDHLHLELTQGGATIDPEPYISPCFDGVYGQGAGTPLKCKGK